MQNSSNKVELFSKENNFRESKAKSIAILSKPIVAYESGKPPFDFLV